MNKQMKIGLSVVCIMALTAGTASAAGNTVTKTLQAQYPDIKMVVNGQAVTPQNGAGTLVEPFIVDGTVYLPMRVVGEAVGKSIEWDAQTHTVYIGKAPMEEDAQQLIDTFEQTHPAFALDAVPEGYQAAKEALLEQAQKPDCTVYDLTWAMMAYTASLGDEHTHIDPFGGVPQAALDVAWIADGGKLYLLAADGTVTKAEVTSIGGVATETLFAVIDHYVASENQAGRDLNHAEWAASPAMLIKAGAAFSADNTLTLEVKDSGQTASRTVGLAMDSGDEAESVITTQMMGQVMYVDFNQCQDGTEMQQAVAALAKAVESGTHQVIIDVRGNGGGNSDTCVQLLNAMGMAPPHYGAYVRYSPLAKGTYPNIYDQDKGGERYAPQPEAAKANPKVQLVVLTDEKTFSSANMMAVYVRDGKLGTLIGRPSSNMPNHYGDILAFNLEHTRTYCTVSHKQWLRPDQSAKGNTLTPDIVTAVGEDALQSALAYLKEQQ